MAHLMRRAGFRAKRDELEAYVAKGYEARRGDAFQRAKDYFVSNQDELEERGKPTWNRSLTCCPRITSGISRPP